MRNLGLTLSPFTENTFGWFYSISQKFLVALRQLTN